MNAAAVRVAFSLQYDKRTEPPPDRDVDLLLDWEQA